MEGMLISEGRWQGHRVASCAPLPQGVRLGPLRRRGAVRCSSCLALRRHDATTRHDPENSLGSTRCSADVIGGGRSATSPLYRPRLPGPPRPVCGVRPDRRQGPGRGGSLTHDGGTLDQLAPARRGTETSQNRIEDESTGGAPKKKLSGPACGDKRAAFRSVGTRPRWGVQGCKRLGLTSGPARNGGYYAGGRQSRSSNRCGRIAGRRPGPGPGRAPLESLDAALGREVLRPTLRVGPR